MCYRNIQRYEQQQRYLYEELLYACVKHTDEL
jgi:hypothetical protein